MDHNLAWTGLLALLLACLYAVSAQVTTSTQVTASSSLRSPTKLVYIKDFVYVGGKNILYKLDKDNLEVIKSALLARDISCGGEACSIQAADDGWVNYISQYSDSNLILCSTLVGHCEIRSLDDLTLTTVSQGYIVSNQRTSTVVATISPFKDNGVAQPAIWIASSYYEYTKSYAMASRKPDFSLTVQNQQEGVFTSGYSSAREYSANPANLLNMSSLHYLYSFSHNGFRFFVKRKGGKSSVAGLCNNDKKFTTLVEVSLACSADGGQTKHVIQAAHSAGVSSNLLESLGNSTGISQDDTLLYAAFGETTTSQALSVCMFSAKQLVAKFQQAFISCHRHGDTRDVRIGPAELTRNVVDCTSVSMT